MKNHLWMNRFAASALLLTGVASAGLSEGRENGQGNLVYQKEFKELKLSMDTRFVDHQAQIAKNASESKSHGLHLDTHLRWLNEHAQTLNVHLDVLKSHTQRLENHDGVLGEHGKTLSSHTATLGEHTKTLSSHATTLADHGKSLSEHSATLGQHDKTLASHAATLGEHTRGIADQRSRLEQINQELKARADSQEQKLGQTDARVTQAFTSFTAAVDLLSTELYNVQSRLTDIEKMMAAHGMPIDKDPEEVVRARETEKLQQTLSVLTLESNEIDPAQLSIADLEKLNLFFAVALTNPELTARVKMLRAVNVAEGPGFSFEIIDNNLGLEVNLAWPVQKMAVLGIECSQLKMSAKKGQTRKRR